MVPLIIEVCVDSVESAIAAIRGGANRLELCSSLGLGGGTTPSMGLFKAVKRVSKDVPVMVMIRPRTGDFVYSTLEIDVMLDDIRTFKQAGANGFVFGVLKTEGRVDLDRTFILAAQAAPSEVCFHRAFDMTRDPMEALRDLKSIPGITRILTSGQENKAPLAIPMIQELLREAKRALTILPGSGINPDTVGPLLDSLGSYGVKEIHLSAGEWVSGEMSFRRDDMGMGIGGAGEWGVWRTKEETVRAVRKIADDFSEARRAKAASQSA